MSFSSWISSLRIEEAKRIMANDPQQKLIDVAYNSGFSSLAYFSSVFVKAEGISPSAWLRGFSRNSEGEQKIALEEFKRLLNKIEDVFVFRSLYL